jgi:hypothetical protein
MLLAGKQNYLLPEGFFFLPALLLVSSSPFLLFLPPPPPPPPAEDDDGEWALPEGVAGGGAHDDDNADDDGATAGCLFRGGILANGSKMLEHPDEAHSRLTPEPANLAPDPVAAAIAQATAAAAIRL